MCTPIAHSCVLASSVATGQGIGEVGDLAVAFALLAGVLEVTTTEPTGAAD
jgi:hypothetical protein